MKYLDARYEVPTEKHFRQRMLPDVYDAVRKGVCDVMTEAKSVSLTTDTWSTSAVHKFSHLSHSALDRQ